MFDAVGNEIKAGDIVRPTGWDPSRGTSLGILHVNAEVLGFGRTRILIQSHAHAKGDTDRVGPECVLVWAAVDGRALRTWSNKREDDRQAAQASQGLNSASRS